MADAPSTISTISIVVGLVLSVLSFNETRKKEAEARLVEAAKPFLELRQKFYLEALEVAGVLANPEVHNKSELEDAKKKFRDLYVARLSMVEDLEVETKMVALAKKVDEDLIKLNDAQRAALDLAHALRDSFRTSWGLDRKS